LPDKAGGKKTGCLGTTITRMNELDAVQAKMMWHERTGQKKINARRKGANQATKKALGLQGFRDISVDVGSR